MMQYCYVTKCSTQIPVISKSRGGVSARIGMQNDILLLLPECETNLSGGGGGLVAG